MNATTAEKIQTTCAIAGGGAPEGHARRSRGWVPDTRVFALRPSLSWRVRPSRDRFKRAVLPSRIAHIAAPAALKARERPHQRVMGKTPPVGTDNKYLLPILQSDANLLLNHLVGAGE
jgi:hypothetical protein